MNWAAIWQSQRRRGGGMAAARLGSYDGNIAWQRGPLALFSYPPPPPRPPPRVCVCKKWTNSSWLSLPLLKIISWENHPSRYREVECTTAAQLKIQNQEKNPLYDTRTSRDFCLSCFQLYFFADFSWGCLKVCWNVSQNTQSNNFGMHILHNERIF